MSARLSLALRLPEEEIETWATTADLFFVLALGRSGSMFLAHLLQQAPRAYVCHEPVRADFVAYQAAYHHPDEALDYLRRFRMKDLYLRTLATAEPVYGEVNSNLRRHAEALGQVFPRAIRLHLVRDGRDVVRSTMSRRTFHAWDPVTFLICPHAEDPLAEAWPQMDRFERLCWYWTVENRYLRHALARHVQFERLLSSYDYFVNELLVPLGLSITRDMWRTARQHPKNATSQYGIPHWSNWDSDKKAAFERICGQEMHENGYEVNWQ